MNVFPDQEVDEIIEEKIKDADTHDLVVYNDDVNTFDHVINTLIDVCDNAPEQAEQCTYIIHYKGKCVVKNGEFPRLATMCKTINDRGISAEVK